MQRYFDWLINNVQVWTKHGRVLVQRYFDWLINRDSGSQTGRCVLVQRYFDWLINWLYRYVSAARFWCSVILTG
ncbi:hypothetical protein HMPREF1248_0952 [Coriobacteriaceae bacterium BV3Ac1]|nr:hypothetical protein HMPREF1248_0952 [Coriobacteriaceae bacterium BV3Ac1]